MKDLETNKIIASILLASLIIMITAMIANVLYRPNLALDQRGYSIDVFEEDSVAGLDSSSSVFKPNIEELMNNANAQSGKNLIKKCLTCHTFDKNGPNKVGPNLWNIVDAKKADVAGFKYSKALEDKGGIWDLESLFQFLYKPNKFIPKTKMSFIGLAKPQEIADVIKYLQEFASSKAQ
ncbi:MAG: cytochrome c family protein [Rickettsiaceae bacterium]